MDEKKYNEELGRIAEITKKKLYELQKGLTEEQVKSIDYRSHFDFFWLFLLMSAVGEEAVVHYLIELLNQASKYDWKKRGMNEEQMERFNKIRQEDKVEE